MAAELIKKAVEAFSQRVLVVAHRKELIDQFHAVLLQAGLRVGVMRGQDERTDPAAPVQVGTIQTLARRELPKADLVIVDEAHRCPGESYCTLLEAYPLATILGLTATPARLDGKPLSDHFDTLVQVAPYSELIQAGAIVAPTIYAARVLPKLKGVRRTAGDFNEGDLAQAVRHPHVVGDVVRSWLRLARLPELGPCHEPLYLPTVLFAVSIEHSKELVQRFGDNGCRAAHLDGSTPEHERERILGDLDAGRLDLVSNVGVLCEGWDQPRVKCLIMTRPTLSLALWMQCAGRILRPHLGQTPLILDHSGNVDRHGMPHEDRVWSLEGKVTRGPVAQAFRMCRSCYAYVVGFPCPICGAEGDVKERRIRNVPGEMHEVTPKRAPPKETGDPQRDFFNKAAEEARKKGFVPGYAAVKFKEKFGDRWPPWACIQALKDEFSHDTAWQERVEKRQRERAFWQDKRARSLEAAPEPIEAYGYTQDPEEDDGGAFDELLRG
jgi:superfamily II DNA or RNA helicase